MESAAARQVGASRSVVQAASRRGEKILGQARRRYLYDVCDITRRGTLLVATSSFIGIKAQQPTDASPTAPQFHSFNHIHASCSAGRLV